MSIATVYLTKKCRCENPNIELFRVRRVKHGKQIGRKRYTYQCKNCFSIWETFKEI